MMTAAYRAIAEYEELDRLMSEHGDNGPGTEAQRRKCIATMNAYKRVKVAGRRTIDVRNGYHYRTTADGSLIRTAL